MKKTNLFVKSTAILMSAMMLLTSSPLTTFADETLAGASSDVQTEAVSEVGSTEQSGTDTAAADTTAADTAATVAATDTTAAADTAADTIGAASAENAAADTTAEAAAPVPSVTDATAGQTTTAEAATVEGTTAAAATNKWTATAADGAVITAEAAENVLASNLTLKVVPEEISESLQDAVDQKAIDNQFSIVRAAAYDISFVDENGNEVEPNQANGTVSVTILNTEISADSAKVFHVDDTTGALSDVDTEVKNDSAIGFETDSFSKYIITAVSNTVTVKVQHYKYDSTNITKSTELYSEDIKTLAPGASITNFAKAENWNVEKVYYVNTDGSLTLISPDAAGDYKLTATADKTIRVYYSPKTTEINGDVNFYDYYVRNNSSTNSNSINYSGNYSKESTETNRFSIGASKAYTETKVNNKLINVFTSGTGDDAYKTGIVTGLSDDFTTVKFSVYEPGVFSSDTKNTAGKTVLKNYKLYFTKIGDSYKLAYVNNPAGAKVASSGSDFWPLDSLGKGTAYDAANNEGHNDYFGMRYDVNFKIGDYLGDLNYSFSGDDDLWVILDGKCVVIDLGGIHSTLSGSVDLWKVLAAASINNETLANVTPAQIASVTSEQVTAYKKGQTDEQKNASHRLTILYMERGAGKSNCTMNFTLPSATIVSTSTVTLGELDLKKVDTAGNGVQGATFTLTNDSDSNEMYTATSDADGVIKFDTLRADATYTLEETSPADGYVSFTSGWKVVVGAQPADTSVKPTVTLEDINGTAITDTQYESSTTATDGKTAIVYHLTYRPSGSSAYYIVNRTSDEVLQASLNYDKKVTVSDWDSRTYNIDITASSKTTSSQTVTSGGTADVMLVLDRSGSMNWGESTTSKAAYTELGTYKDKNGTLDTTKTYYLEYSTYNSTYYYTMRYFSDAWEVYSGSTWYKVTDYADDFSDCQVCECLSRMTALKEAASSFLASMAGKSSGSNVGIASFSSAGDGDGELNAALATIGSDATSFIKAVNELNANGGTSPELGLAYASSEFTNVSSDGLPKYVILFTDGTPTGNTRVDGTSADTIANWSSKNATETAIQSLKESGVKVFTIGFGLKDSSNAKSWLSETIASGSDYAFTASNTSDLLKIFNTISNTITSNTSIENAEVKDVIDDRFEITDGTYTYTASSDGKVVKKDSSGTVKEEEDGDTGIAFMGGVIKYGETNTDSTQKHLYIVWTSQTIPNIATSTWKKTIQVKAKDTYIGGNNVVTNISPDSYISTDFGKATLPQPSVNVKTSFTVGDGEQTIFWGDTAQITDEVRLSMFDIAKQQYTVGSDGGTVTNSDFEYNWYTDASCTTAAGNLSELTPDSDTTYYLKVTYKNVGTTTADSKKNTNGNVASADASKVGKYTIHVVKGQLVITKKIDSQYTDISAKNAEQTFVYKVVRYAVTKDASGNETQDIQPAETFYVTLAFDANGKSTTASSVLSGLKKGYYSVTEETDWSKKYDLTNTADNYSGNSNEGQLIYIGQNKGVVTEETNKGKVIFTGLEPKASYMEYAVSYTNGAIASDPKTYPAEVTFKNNIKANWYWLSDVAAAVNKFVKQATT